MTTRFDTLPEWLIRLAPLDETMPLDAGVPIEGRRQELLSLDWRDRLGRGRMHDDALVRGMMAALWLYANDLDASHRISQELADRTGSYLHGMMHRREGDYSNAKYWFARAGEHAVFPQVLEEARRVAGPMSVRAEVRSLLGLPSWSPGLFVDLVAEEVRRASADREALVRIQQAEWWTLFCWLYGRAGGDEQGRSSSSLDAE
jgi:hypothetical protein